MSPGTQNFKGKPESYDQWVSSSPEELVVIFRIDAGFVKSYHSPMKDDDFDPPVPSERSATAREVSKLQETIRRLVDEREVLPQPLFWSLFNSRLADIKKQKEVARLLRGTLEGVE